MLRQSAPLVSELPAFDDDPALFDPAPEWFVPGLRPTDGAKGIEVLAEYRPRNYFRIFSVPQGIDATKIDAQLIGVLRLRLPKSDAVKPRRIEVKQG